MIAGLLTFPVLSVVGLYIKKIKRPEGFPSGPCSSAAVTAYCAAAGAPAGAAEAVAVSV